MNILTITGSANRDSANQKFLKALPSVITQHHFIHFDGLIDFPLFTTEGDKKPSELILSFKEHIKNADLILISFPEYIHNMPAVLKNALEWTTSSGEFDNKKVFPISYTPSSPRGEKAMQSLVWSLQALNAKIIAQLALYQSELKISANGVLEGDSSIETIKTIFDFIS